jgi:cytochrome d ubiquinol oxidase subunit II
VTTLWFIIVNLAIAAFAVTDGFDLGVGMLSPLIARNEKECSAVRETIGHVWEANQVWLLALGGLLFLAFPRVYAASFSGFYLAFMILLWCLIGRGLAIETRSHLSEPVWRSACDILLPIASFVVALALGTAAGNVLRGVPLDAQGRMYLPLWSNLSVKGEPAIFDWYTLVTGLLGVAVFCLHGASYLAMRTDGELRIRARRLAGRAWWPTAVLTAASLSVTPLLNRAVVQNYNAHPALYILIALVVVLLVAPLYFRRRLRDGAAFVSSSLLIVAMITSAAVGLYPNLLPAHDPKNSLTIDNAAAGTYGLKVALIWFALGLALVVIYTLFVYRLFSRKPASQTGGY